MQQVFVLPSHSRFADFDRLVGTFVKVQTTMPISFHKVNSVGEINNFPKTGIWYGVLYDNEALSIGLSESLGQHLLLNDADVLVFFRKNLKRKVAEFFPRFYIRSIKIRDNLSPIGDAFMTNNKILDGWILSF